MNHVKPVEIKPTWENTFNSRFKWWGHISHALDYAHKGGYPYLLWNDRIYTAEGKDTNLTVEDLRK